jgi:hypothetical protein
MSYRSPIICILLLIALAPVFAQRTVNHGLHAPPAPAGVVIDGDLREWDTSGAIDCTKDVATLLATESAQVAAMWDATYLYLGIRWRDATPMINRVDPVTMAGNGWRSDSVQLRLNLDGFVSHVDCWYYTLGQRPAMSITYGRFGVKDGGQPAVDRPKDPQLLGAKQAFRPAADGKGYVQELKLPWAVVTLDGKAPKTDADLRLGLELFWGDRDGDTWPRSRVTDNLVEGEAQTDFFWTNTKAWGRLLLEPAGHLTLPLPAWKRPAAVEPQGPVAITFTLPAEKYVTLAIEDAAGNRVCSLLGGVKLAKGEHTVYWSGLDDRNTPLPAGPYRWTGLTRDAIDVRWKMSYYQPNPHTPWGNAAGTGAWGPDHGTLVAAAAGGDLVYLVGTGVEAGYALFAVDKTGAKRWTAKFCEAERLAYADGRVYAYTGDSSVNFLGITARGLMQLDAKTGEWLDVPGPHGKPVKRRSLLNDGEELAGFSADSNGLYLSVKGKGVVRAFARQTLTLTREYPVAQDGELFAPGDGTLLMAAPVGVLSLNLTSGAVATLASGDLTGARAITADKAGTVFVAVGAPRHQVYTFARQPDRQWGAMEPLGKAGGRTQNGWYDPNEGFRNPTGLTVDGQGQLWVVEKGYAPKRVSVWKERRWIRDFIGDTAYGGGGVINPQDPTMAFYDDMQFAIDLDKGTATLKGIGLVRPKELALLAPPDAKKFTVGGAEVKVAERAPDFMLAAHGRAYLLTCRGAREIYRERPDKRWTLCVYINSEAKIGWVDTNDDGEIQPGEITRGDAAAVWGSNDYWGMRPSQTLDQFFANSPAGRRLRCQGVTPGGTPRYDFEKFEPMAAECQNGIGLRDGSYNSGCQGERGEYFSEMRKAYPAGTATRTFWYRGENTGRWTYRLPAPGLVLYPYQAHGIADVPSIRGEVICWVSDFGQRYLFTDDMLFVAQLFQDGRSVFDNWPDAPQRDFLANTMAPGQESFGGQFIRCKDGRYLLTSGFTDCRVFEVLGLNSLRRMAGALTLAPAQLAQAQEIRQFRLRKDLGDKQLLIPRTPTPLTADGKLADWAPSGKQTITVDDARGASLRACYDPQHLYVAWEVRDGSPLINQASRTELAFKGGDAVDLMFRLPGAQLSAPGVRAGDLRLLITALRGTPVAVLYRPVSATKQPFTFDAFEGAGRGNAVAMDEVRIAGEVPVGIVRQKDSYIVEAALPWTLLGVTPAAKLEGRLDFGVLFSDPTGMQTALRTYWANRDTNIVADIPSEARLQPGNWGTFRLGE